MAGNRHRRGPGRAGDRAVPVARSAAVQEAADNRHPARTRAGARGREQGPGDRPVPRNRLRRRDTGGQGRGAAGRGEQVLRARPGAPAALLGGLLGGADAAAARAAGPPGTVGGATRAAAGHTGARLRDRAAHGPGAAVGAVRAARADRGSLQAAEVRAAREWSATSSRTARTFSSGRACATRWSASPRTRRVPWWCRT